MEPWERKMLKIQKEEDNGHGMNSSKEEITLDGKNETGGDKSEDMPQEVTGNSSESHPFLYEVGNKIIQWESEEIKTACAHTYTHTKGKKRDV